VTGPLDPGTMTAAVGWTATALLGAMHLRARRRLVLVARASHELRGPLCAARLSLHGLTAEPGRVAAIDLELLRAGRALDDLAAAPSGGRGPSRPELVDVAALAHAYAPAWRTLALAHGAGLKVDAVPGFVPGATLGTSPPLPGVASDVTFGSPPPLQGLAPGAPLGSAPSSSSPPARAGSPLDELARLRAGRSARAVGATAVVGDPLRIAQACANLVANAAEHGGGTVRLRVRAAGGWVRIEVADDGPGLPAPVAALIAAARGRQGRRGHGLAIAAAIAGHHGGRLAAAPTRTGARLVLELPAAALDARRAAPRRRTRRRAAAGPAAVPPAA
jgi:signal transduction histidine kinase